LLPYNINKIDLISMLHTDPEKGLTSDQVHKLIEEHGENKLKEARKKQICKGFSTSLRM
jgi:magnesium-transporting ATPase (P-type)